MMAYKRPVHPVAAKSSFVAAKLEAILSVKKQLTKQSTNQTKTVAAANTN